MFVRIIRRPDGEAPEWVRDAWIGVRLPIAHPQPANVEGIGVLAAGKRPILATLVARLTGRTFAVSGYVVHGPDAIAALADTRPDAADWWRTNCPRIADGSGGALVFNTHECQREENES